MGVQVVTLDWVHFALKDWACTITIGFLVSSYWRGTWTLLDIWFCSQPSDASLREGNTFCFMVDALAEEVDGGGPTADMRVSSARLSYGIGLALLFVGVTLTWSGSWLPRIELAADGTALPGRVTPSLAIVRFLIVYLLGASAVCLWRGIWYWTDHWILVDKPLASYWTTSLVGSTVAFCLGAGASILAPPAIFLLDGPGASPPPIAVTIISSYYSVTLPADEKPPKLSLLVRVVDLITSFVFLPFCVVWFWRGSWLVLDNYLWGFTISNRDINASLGWGTIVFLICIGITSEPIVAFVDKKVTSKKLLYALGCLRTWVLAWGTVAFWRVVWYVWDQFLAGPTYGSCWLSHALGVAILTLMGAASCIVAPASTIGVDAVPHPLCADEPLFSMIPIPYDILYFLGMARQEWARDLKKHECWWHRNKDVIAPPDDGGEVELAQIEENEELPIGASNGSEEKKLGDEEVEEGIAQASSSRTGSGRNRNVFHTVRSWRPGPDGGVFHTVRSWRPGPDGGVVSYHELQRPGLGDRTCSEYAQRPSENNKRSRTKLFRSR